MQTLEHLMSVQPPENVCVLTEMSGTECLEMMPAPEHSTIESMGCSLLPKSRRVFKDISALLMDPSSSARASGPSRGQELEAQKTARAECPSYLVKALEAATAATAPHYLLTLLATTQIDQVVVLSTVSGTKLGPSTSQELHPTGAVTHEMLNKADRGTLRCAVQASASCRNKIARPQTLEAVLDSCQLIQYDAGEVSISPCISELCGASTSPNFSRCSAFLLIRTTSSPLIRDLAGPCD